MFIHHHKNIAVAYHFLAEAMIIFLFAVPFMHGKYQWVPYWGYLGLAVGICLLFSLYTKYTSGYTWYIVTAPVLMGLFYLFGYSIFLSVGFPILLTFRYIFLRKDTMLKRESTYISVTIILSIFLLIWIKGFQLIIYAFLILMILLTGHIFSHFMAMGRNQRETIKRKLWITIGTFVGISSAGLLLLYFSRNILTGIWSGMMTILGYFGAGMGYLFGYFFPDDTELPARNDMNEIEGEPIQEKSVRDILPEGNGSSIVEDYSYLFFWGIGFIVLIIIIILAIRYFRTRFSGEKEKGAQDVVSYSQLDEASVHEKASLFSRIFKAPEHKVRKLIFQLERDADKANVGRFSYETLDMWLERLGYTIDMSTYKKVRYGNVDKVSDSEVQTLKELLQEIRDTLRRKRKNK